MTITYYADKVRETTVNTGTGNLVLSGAITGFRTFVNGIGSDKTLTYYIYRQDTNFEWEIGVGYIYSSGGINQLIRQRVVSSSNNNNLVSFSSGTKYVEPIIAQNRINSGLLNLESKSSSFSAPYAPATYIIDASVSGVSVNLPEVASEDDPILLSFLLNATISGVYEQANAILLTPYGSETINGVASTDSVTIIHDVLQLVSVPSQSGWLTLDPIQDSTNPYGNDGYIQFKYNGSFSGVNTFVWDNINSALLIGNSGNANADIVLSAPSGQTTIFNQRLYDKDFRIAGTGNSHLVFVDGGLNAIGINTSSPYDTLTINSNNYNGISIFKSGVGPTLLLGNTAISGAATNGVVGSIVYSGLNNANAPIIYGKIITNIESSSSGNESSFVSIGIMNVGSYEDVAVFSPSGITLGFNSSNTDGTIIGGTSSNEGNNVVLGYYNNVCGQNCVVAGDNITVSSGTFGGVIGSNHSASGNNIWIIGGDGLTASGNNRTYLSVDANNYFAILDSGNATLTTLINNDSILYLKNKAILASGGIDQSISFNFTNSSGIEKTGLILSSEIDSPINNLESTRLVAKILTTGVQKSVIDLTNNNLVIGANNYSGSNVIFGFSNTINNSSGNYLFGSNILTSGSNNVLFGKDVSASGTDIIIFGINNQCFASGNASIVSIGKNNEINEDYVVAVGISNANSGLYSVSCGYMNGIHGDYSVGMGEANLVTSNSSVAVGKNNSLSSTSADGSLFALGVGNYGQVSNTGFLLGYVNEVYGSGGLVFGRNIKSSGNNNIIIGSNTIVSGINNILLSHDSTASFNDSNTIKLYSSSGNYLNVNNSGITISNTGNYLVFSNSGLYINSLSTPTGLLSVSNIVYQNNFVKAHSIATSGSLVSPLYLNVTDANYQFLYPSGSSIVYLPHGSGLYLGKEFSIYNMDTSNNIMVRKSGSAVDIETILPSRHMSIIHAGDDKWVRIVSSGIN